MNCDVLISVIIPVYNVEKYLKRCLDSIIKQTYSNLEIILVDDGSTDNSGSICDMYKSIDKRIKVFHKKNGGLSSARNYGLNKATSNIIGFVDSDDCLNEKMYEKLLLNLLNNDADISICSVYKFSENSDLEKINNSSISISCFENNLKYLKLIEEKDLDSILVSNKLYKKEVFKYNKFLDGKIHEDAFIMHHLFNYAKRIVYTNEYLFYYFVRNDSISNVYNLERLDEIEAIKDRLKFFKNKKFNDTNYYEIVFKSYVGYLINHFFYLNYYNKNNCYKKYIKLIKKEYDDNYNKIITYPNINIYDHLKYFIVRYIPFLYLISKKIDIIFFRRKR